MNVLAIDTSLPVGSVAALIQSDSGPRMIERPLGEAGEHARRLMPEVVAAAAALGWRISDLDLVAVVRGPGSFTGLRVGVTTAKTLCWATGATLVGVSGFEAVARHTAAVSGRREQVAIAFDAGRGEVYAAVATPDEESPSGWLVNAGEVVAADRWLDSIPAGRWVSGPALEILGAAARDRGLTVASRETWRPSASEVATIAILRAAAGVCDDPHTLLPEYSRPSYAEEKKPGRTG